LARHDSCWHRTPNVRAIAGAVQDIANIFPIIKGLWAQIVIGLVSVGILGVGIWAITEYGNSKPWVYWYPRSGYSV